MSLEQITEASQLYHYHRFLSREATEAIRPHHEEQSKQAWDQLVGLRKSVIDAGGQWNAIDEAEEKGKFAARAAARDFLTAKKA